MLRVAVVGGVAGGATAAARLRRVRPDGLVMDIFERSPDVSFANCGLPYYLGREITDPSRLALHTPSSLSQAIGATIHSETTVTAIDAKRKTVLFKKNGSSSEGSLEYDKLIFSPGASPVRPAIKGFDHPRVFTLRNLQDMNRLDSVLQNPSTNNVVVVGAGFIGLEVVEQLRRLKKHVTLVEKATTVLPQADVQMSEFLHVPLVAHGIQLRLDCSVTSIEGNHGATGSCVADSSAIVHLSNGEKLSADCIVLCVGVRPESSLAAEAGLGVSEHGRVTVDDYMRTTNPDIYAVGDVVETRDLVFPNHKSWVALGNVANMQARIAADHAATGKSIPYKGSLGSSIVRVFDHVLAITGWAESRLKAALIPYGTAIITADHHASYYPGSKPVTLKITYDPMTGRLYGAQAVGTQGVDKRIDVVATAIQGGLTIDDLSQTQLTYSPPFGSARDVVNVAALAARNSRDGLVKLVNHMPSEAVDHRTVVDVRPNEVASLSPIPHSLNIPYTEFTVTKEGQKKLKPEGKYTTICALGRSSYFASRAIAGSGFDVQSVTGGLTVQRKPPLSSVVPVDEDEAGCTPTQTVTPTCGVAAKPSASTTAAAEAGTTPTTATAASITLDCSGMSCPGPLMKLRQTMDRAAPGTTVHVVATDLGFANDVKAFADANDIQVVSLSNKGGQIHADLKKKGGPVASAGAAAPSSAVPPATGKRNGASIVVFSQEMDKVLAAFVIANGAAAMGGNVTMFFTFWGLNALRKPDGKSAKPKAMLDAMFGWMMPKGKDKLPISNMNFAGVGPKLLRYQMGAKNLPNVDGLLKDAQRQNVRIVACTMSMDAMGITREELIDGIELGGVADFMAASSQTGTNLFI